MQAQRDLDQAELNLRYCDVVSEIDGVVTRPQRQSRQQRPGRAKPDGRPLADGDLDRRQLQGNAVGRPAHRPAGALEVDMYGSRQEFEGRITGFTMGTGQTLALLPPQNATGNFVKIVQRLPVRIELTNYDPDKNPCSSACRSRLTSTIKEPPAGPNAGEFLQPFAPMLPHSTPQSPNLDREREGAAVMSSVALAPSAASRARRSTPGSSPSPWSSRRSWRWWTRRSPTSRCGTLPAACRRRSSTASGSSPATWPPTPSSCRSPAGFRPTSAAATISSCRSPSSPSPRGSAAWPPACRN